jgi:YVTN family beta-propeller protein
VTVLDATTGRRLRTFHVGARPRFVIFRRDGRRREGFVSAENGGTVVLVDADADSVVSTIAVGDRTTKPTGLALSPDGQRLYVANGRSNEVVVIDVATRAARGAVRTGERPWGIALTDDGRYLYTADGRSGSVSVIDTVAGKVVATIAVGGRPYGVLLVR